MGTVIRNDLSQNGPYWIPKHRYLELYHYCLQYPDWQKEYNALELNSIQVSNSENYIRKRDFSKNDPVEKIAEKMAELSSRMQEIEDIARKVDPEIYEWLVAGVTKGYSYPYLNLNLGLPCGRSTYYDRYRKFFYILSRTKD